MRGFAAPVIGLRTGCFCDETPVCSCAGRDMARVAAVAIGGCRAMTSGRSSLYDEPSTTSQPAEDISTSAPTAIVASATMLGMLRLERKKTRRRFSGQIGREGRRALNPRLPAAEIDPMTQEEPFRERRDPAPLDRLSGGN